MGRMTRPLTRVTLTTARWLAIPRQTGSSIRPLWPASITAHAINPSPVIAPGPVGSREHPPISIALMGVYCTNCKHPSRTICRDCNRWFKKGGG